MAKKGGAKTAGCFIVCALLVIIGVVFKYPFTQDFSLISMDTVITGEFRSSITNADALEHYFTNEINNTASKINRFDPASEIAQANAMPPGEWMQVSDSLAAALEKLAEIQKESGGALDLTLGKLSDLWDFNGGDPKVPSAGDIKELLNAKRGFNINGLRLDIEDGGELDFGAVGKGLACDCIAENIGSWDLNIRRAVISVGGSIFLYGNGEFSVGIRKPGGGASEIFAALNMRQGFLSTSGRYERFFEEGGKRYHHILDPKTGYPVQNGLTSVTVIAGSGLLSDALSTACFVLGYEKSKPLLEKYNAKAVFADEEMLVRLYPSEAWEGIDFDLTDTAFSIAKVEQ
jgi:thiamine biosynthesis lipoprotein